MIHSPYSPLGQYDMQFTPLLPSQLLMGSPFQPGTPAIAQFTTFAGSTPGYGNGSTQPGDHPQPYSYMPQQFYSIDDATQRTRTVYLGNMPQDTTAEELLNHVRSGVIDMVKMVPEKNCAFISFLDHSSAAHFHSDAILKKLSINGQDIKVGWGKSGPVAPSISMAVSQDGASRNVYLGNLPAEITKDEIVKDLEGYGPIDTVKLVKDKNIGFVHFLNIATAIKVVTCLPYDNSKWANRKIYYGKDRCAYISKTQQQNAAQYLGISPGYEHMLAGADRGMLSGALAQQSAAAIAVATAAGGQNNAGNRTVYLGNVHPETTVEEICNVVRGGLLHTIRYIPDKHICFVTFVDPTAAAQFFAMANMHGLSIHNRRLKVGWGKHSGGLPNAVALAVTNGASRNVYIGNIDDNWPESKLRHDFAEYGEIEQINFLAEKSCAFVNFTNITNAIKAIEGIKQKEDYRQFKINFGKDRCGNPPRVLQQHYNDEEGSSSSPPHGRDYEYYNNSSVLGQYLQQIHTEHYQNLYQQHQQQQYRPAVLSSPNDHVDNDDDEQEADEQDKKDAEEGDDEEEEEEEDDVDVVVDTNTNDKPETAKSSTAAEPVEKSETIPEGESDKENSQTELEKPMYGLGLN